MAVLPDLINIKYVNNTLQTDFDVMVFTKNFSTRTPKTYYAAWHVLRGQTSVTFQYPVHLAVGASYQENGLKISSGPFEAELGSTWKITQPKMDDTAMLSEVPGLVPNPNGTIVIENKQPTAWSGRMFDVGIFKDGRLLVTQKDVHCGDQVDFMLQPRIYFGVVRNVHVGDVFTSLEITSSLAEFDLSNYPHGLEVTLTEGPGGGKYLFQGVNKKISY